MYTHVNDAWGIVAAVRSSGGPTLTLNAGQGARFGSPSPSEPIRLIVRRKNPAPTGDMDRYPLVCILSCDGRAGDALDINGPIEGPDAAAQPGDVVLSAVTAGDMSDLADEVVRLDGLIDAIELTPGPKGDQGEPGTGITAGSSAPSGGKDGDLYVRTTNWDIYERSAGAWSVIGNIKGAQGDQGSPGADGAVWRHGSTTPPNGTGKDGDYYLRTSNGDVYARSGGTYSVVGNIKGDKGDKGDTGAAGDKGDKGDPGPGVPPGGLTGQVLAKKSAVDYDGEWIDPPESGSAATFIDTFVDTAETPLESHVPTPNGGAGWTAISGLGGGGITVDPSGKIRGSMGESIYVAPLTVDSPNCSASWTYSVASLDSLLLEVWGGGLRVDPATDSGYYAIRQAQAGQDVRWAVVKRVEGAETVLDYADVPWAAGSFNVEFRANGDRLTLTVDNAVLVSVTDATFAGAGKFAILSRWNTLSFDDLDGRIGDYEAKGVTSGGGGTVTSVGLTMPAGFSVSGGPITTAGSLTVTTSLSGLVKAGGGDFVAAVAGTDYATPAQLAAKADAVTTVTTDTPQTITGVKTFGRIKLEPNGTGDRITTTGKSLILEQTGDTYGATRLELANRDNFNGALFENQALWLVDFQFAAMNDGSRIVRAIRYDTSGRRTGEPEFIFGDPAGSDSFVVGDTRILAKVGFEVQAAMAINRKAVAVTPYNVATADCLLAVTGPASARSVALPNSTTVGRLVTVKDEAGDAATHNITVSVAGSGTIDGGATAVISTNHGVLRLYHSAAGKWRAI